MLRRLLGPWFQKAEDTPESLVKQIKENSTNPSKLKDILKKLGDMLKTDEDGSLTQRTVRAGGVPAILTSMNKNSTMASVHTSGCRILAAIADLDEADAVDKINKSGYVGTLEESSQRFSDENAKKLFRCIQRADEAAKAASTGTQSAATAESHSMFHSEFTSHQPSAPPIPPNLQQQYQISPTYIPTSITTTSTSCPPPPPPPSSSSPPPSINAPPAKRPCLTTIQSSAFLQEAHDACRKIISERKLPAGMNEDEACAIALLKVICERKAAWTELGTGNNPYSDLLKSGLSKLARPRHFGGPLYCVVQEGFDSSRKPSHVLLTPRLNEAKGWRKPEMNNMIVLFESVIGYDVSSILGDEYVVITTENLNLIGPSINLDRTTVLIKSN